MSPQFLPKPASELPPDAPDGGAIPDRAEQSETLSASDAPMMNRRHMIGNTLKYGAATITIPYILSLAGCGKADVQDMGRNKLIAELKRYRNDLTDEVINELHDEQLREMVQRERLKVAIRKEFPDMSEGAVDTLDAGEMAEMLKNKKVWDKYVESGEDTGEGGPGGMIGRSMVENVNDGVWEAVYTALVPAMEIALRQIRHIINWRMGLSGNIDYPGNIQTVERSPIDRARTFAMGAGGGPATDTTRAINEHSIEGERASLVELAKNISDYTSKGSLAATDVFAVLQIFSAIWGAGSLLTTVRTAGYGKPSVGGRIGAIIGAVLCAKWLMYHTYQSMDPDKASKIATSLASGCIANINKQAAEAKGTSQRNAHRAEQTEKNTAAGVARQQVIEDRDVQMLQQLNIERTKRGLPLLTSLPAPTPPPPPPTTP